MSRPRHPGEFIAGDALRGWGSLWVFAFHVIFVPYVLYTRALPHDAVQPSLADLFGVAPARLIGVGTTALDIFFALSGYLIGRPFVRAILEDRPLPSIGDYFTNRVLRIVPIFWVAILIALVHYGPSGAGAGSIVGMFTFVQTYLPTTRLDDWIGQAWTLDIEVGFYICLPLAAIFAAGLLRGRLNRAGRGAVLLAGLLVLFAVSREAVHFHVPERTLIGTLFAFLPGIGLAVVEPFVAPRVAGRKWASWVALALGLLGVVLLWSWVIYDPVHFNVRALLAASGSTAALAAPMLHQWATGRCVWIYDNRAIRWLGERSYSFYLLQLFAIYDITKAFGSGYAPDRLALVAGVPSFVASLALAGLGYRFVERPFLRMRHRWRPRAVVAASS